MRFYREKKTARGCSAGPRGFPNGELQDPRMTQTPGSFSISGERGGKAFPLWEETEWRRPSCHLRGPDSGRATPPSTQKKEEAAYQNQVEPSIFLVPLLQSLLNPTPQNHLSLGIHCSFSPFLPSHHIFHGLLPSSLFIYLFVSLYFWLHWVFGAVHGLPLLAVSVGYSSLRCASFFLWWLLL